MIWEFAKPTPKTVTVKLSLFPPGGTSWWDSELGQRHATFSDSFTTELVMHNAKIVNFSASSGWALHDLRGIEALLCHVDVLSSQIRADMSERDIANHHIKIGDRLTGVLDSKEQFFTVESLGSVRYHIWRLGDSTAFERFQEFRREHEELAERIRALHQ